MDKDVYSLEKHMYKTKFNKNNRAHETGKYPLFFGEQLGLVDTINVTYPEIEDLYQKQISQIWNELEINLTQDKMDMLHLHKDTVDLMVKTVSWQHLGDTIIARSVSALLLPYVTNTELECVINVWSLFETIHARTYSHIVKQTFVDPSQSLIDTYSSYETIVRSDAILKAIDAFANLPDTATIKEKKEALLVTMSAIFALEGIAFMSSFAVTFGIAETGAFQGIGSLVELIARDEMLHTRMAWVIMRILQKEWPEEFNNVSGEIKNTLDAVVQQELDWANYLFSEGRQVIGLSADLLKEYTQYMAKPIYDSVGIKFDFEVIEQNPCPYMDKRFDSSKLQSAPQEVNLTSYKVGAVKDDTDNLELDLDF